MANLFRPRRLPNGSNIIDARLQFQGDEIEKSRAPRKIGKALAVTGVSLAIGISAVTALFETSRREAPQLQNQIHPVHRPTAESTTGNNVLQSTTTLPSQQLLVTTTTQLPQTITQSEVAQADQELRQANASISQIQQSLRKPLGQVSQAAQSISKLERKLPQTKSELENELRDMAMAVGALLVLDIASRVYSSSRSNRRIDGRFASLEKRLGNEDEQAFPDGAA